MKRFFWIMFLAGVCKATQVPALTFEELVAKSDQIVTGHVVRTWTSWGSEHKFIWTRYDVAVDNVVKGAPQKTVTVSEPGGDLDNRRIRIAGAVVYTVGEHVTLFLHTYPSGDKRTVGWSQGKFLVDAQSRVHPTSAGGSEIVFRNGSAASSSRSTPLASLDGITSNDLRSRILNAAAR